MSKKRFDLDKNALCGQCERLRSPSLLHWLINCTLRYRCLLVMITVGDLLKVICDDKSLCIFNTIGLATNHDSDILIRNIGLSRKQFYMRVSKMIEVGLVVRYGRRYNLTTLGKIVYHVQLVIGNALKDHWKLKALDVLNVSEGSIPVAEHKKIVDSIIDNEKIKEMILVRRA